MPKSDVIDLTLDAIRELGGRVTDQRRAILRVLFEGSDHVTADDIAGRVKAQLPDVHITTVYRFLDTLAELGLVTHVHLGHGPAVYHLSAHRHAHVVCERCGEIGVIPDTVLQGWSDQLEPSIGFRLVDQHFAFAGLCQACSTEG